MGTTIVVLLVATLFVPAPMIPNRAQLSFVEKEKKIDCPSGDHAGYRSVPIVVISV